MKNILAITCLSFLFFTANAQIKINEFMASNNSTLDPLTGATPDWIELYNTSNSTIDLSGYFVTDDLLLPNKWAIPAGTSIEGNGFLVIYASGNNGGLHTSFKLSSGGEQIGIYTASGLVLDTLTYGEQYVDISYGRQPDGAAAWSLFNVATLGNVNSTETFKAFAPKPTVSVVGGFYASTQTVSISTSLFGASIRYSLDGSDPDVSSALYSAPISITSTTVLKARVFMTEYFASEVNVNTYFINEADYTMPVISISTAPENLWDNQTGIYVTGTNGIPGYCSEDPKNYNQDWRRAASMELFSASRQREIEHHVGIKIFGGCSRSADQKSLTVTIDKAYDKDKFSYKLFPNKDYTDVESFILRNSGNAFTGNGNWLMATQFNDLYMQRVIHDMDVDWQDGYPVIVYLNGEYWGIQNIRERANGDYVKHNYNISKKDIDFMKNYGEVMEGDDIAFSAMYTWVAQNALSTPANYEQIRRQVDIDSYIDYMIINIFMTNTDWPGNNVKYWRERTEDGKWRWVVFDLDFGFGFGPQYQGDDLHSFDMLAWATESAGPDWPNPPWSTLLFRMMLMSDQFQAKFIQRYAECLETYFEPTAMLTILDSMAAVYEPEMPDHIAKWGWTMDKWYEDVQKMRDYAINRPLTQASIVANHFGLTGLVDVSIANMDTIAGNCLINKRKIIAPDFSGEYFNNTTLRLTALPKDCQSFVSWQVSSQSVEPVDMIGTGDLWKYWDASDSMPTAWNQIVADETGWLEGASQLGYGDGDEATEISFGLDDADKWMAKYFRKTITLADVDLLNSASLSVLYDDGIIVYINGVEAMRKNMPVDPVDNTTPAITFVGGAAENAYTTESVLTNLFIEGTNVIAVEVHQFEPGSSDLSFDLRLAGTKIGATSTDSYTVNPLNLDLNGAITATPIFEDQILPNITDLYINEFSASNVSILADEFGAYADWIEIYNAGSSAIDIGGFYFSDNVSSLTKSQIPVGYPDETTIAAGAYLILWADNDPDRGALHLDFKLASSSGNIVMYQGCGVVVDSISYEKQYDDYSYGREPDGTEDWTMMNLPTPDAANQALLGIDESLATINIYPNPVNDILIIDGSIAGSYRLTSVHGIVLEQGAIERGENTIDLSPYAKGIYILSLNTNQGEVVRRILKQ